VAEQWQEVMKLAEKYGFVIQAYGGTAILATRENQKEHYGDEEYRRIQNMNGHCPTEWGDPECEGGCNKCLESLF